MSMKLKYEIALPLFEGPLDLLLHLIERNELDITMLSLAQVAEQYLQQIEALDHNKVTQLIDFVVVGARLVLIKSRALLPAPPVVLVGEEEEEDPAEALLRQLKTYKTFKLGAQTLAQRQEDGLRSYLRLAPPPAVEARLDWQGISLQTLQAHWRVVLARVAEREKSVSVAAPRQITIEGQIGKLRQLVKIRPNLTFHHILSEYPSSAELSVSLLAVLELLKRHEIDAEQQLPFGPIHIRRGTELSVAQN